MNSPRPRVAINQSNRWLPAVAALGVLIVVIAIGAFGGGDDDAATTSPQGGVEGLTVPASTLPGVVIDSAPPSVVKTNLTRTLLVGLAGDDVARLQTRLAELGFAPGVADGSFGDQTQQAIWAFEKLVLKIPRAQATGKVTNNMWQLIQDPIVIHPRRPDTVIDPPKTHMEIYLPEQVGIVFTANKATLIVHISSGSDQPWCETLLKDTDEKGNPVYPPIESAECGVSKTPGGVFKFTRRVVGERMGPLGGMWNPVYFNKGIAVHGATNIPLEPASHGCIRIHKRISETFHNYVNIGDRVFVWGQDGKEPEAYTKEESLPVFNHKDPNATTTTSTTTTVAVATTIPAPPTTQPKVVATTTTVAAATTTAAPPTP